MRYLLSCRVRAYRQHFDKWGVTKYNRRARPQRRQSQPAEHPSSFSFSSSSLSSPPPSPTQSQSTLGSPDRLGSGMVGFLGNDPASSASLTFSHPWQVPVTPPTSPPAYPRVLPEPTSEHADALLDTWRFESHLAACHAWDGSVPYPSRTRYKSPTILERLA